MIEIPESIKLRRNKKTEGQLLGKVRTWLESEERAEGIHASSLLDLREAYWRTVDPRPIAERLLTVFMVGKVLHAFVLGSASDAGVDLHASDEGSQYDEELDLHYSLDWSIGNEPVEFKTSRSFYEPKDLAGIEIYVEQLLVYMAIKRSLTGQVWVLLLNLRNEDRQTAPAIRCYNIEITPDDLNKLRLDLACKVESLKAAVAAQEPDSLPLCRAWKCSAKACPYWGDCKPPGRYKE